MERLDVQDMQLKFNHCQFGVSNIAEVTIEAVTEPWKAGAIFVFCIQLKNGEFFQISPTNIIVPDNNDDPYYRDKDESWSLLQEIRKILHNNSARWYYSESAKHFARSRGIPVMNQ